MGYVPFASRGYYVYDEQVLLTKLTEEDFNMGITTRGLHQLILRDVLRGQGNFHQLLDERIVLTEQVRRLAEEIIIRETDISAKDVVLHRPLQRLDLTAIVIPTFNRPEALKRALKIRTDNQRYFGH